MMNQMNRGGSRPGAGRPPAEPKLSVRVQLTRPVAENLRKTIPEKARSLWIETLIVTGLKKRSKKRKRVADSEDQPETQQSATV
jgi:hypothetical protein